MPETPRRVSKVRRISRMHETIRDATPSNDEDKETFYKVFFFNENHIFFEGNWVNYSVASSQ